MGFKKLHIDIKTAKQLEEIRLTNGYSWKELYANYFGELVDTVSDKDADALRKHIERKRDRVLHEDRADVVLNQTELGTDKSISYDLEDDDVKSASGTVVLNEQFTDVTDYKKLISALFEEFNLDPAKYEILKYTPSYVRGKFKVWARFERKKFRPYDEEEVLERYKKLLANTGSIHLPEIKQVDTDNILVINMADIHWNKLPYIGFDGNYLANFEKDVYDGIAEILSYVRYFPISRVALTVGHDFFQTNDHRGTTKKGTQVSHVMEYKDMFDTGVQILSNVMYMISKHYMLDAYYILANHDNDASWHASRELKLLFKDAPHVNVIVDKMPFHHVEWGSTLVELIHDNTKGGKSSSNMPVTAREAWGRTKYHYSIGGHLHGEYTLKEKGGIVAMGSRAMSDTDEWHYLNGYLGNIRGIQAYIFNKDNGHVLTVNSNL